MAKRTNIVWPNTRQNESTEQLCVLLLSWLKQRGSNLLAQCLCQTHQTSYLHKWKFKTSCHKIFKWISYYYCHARWHVTGFLKNERCNLLAKTTKNHEIQCSWDMSEPKYMCNARQPNTLMHIRTYTYVYTHIRVYSIYAHTRIQYIRLSLFGMYELTYCFFFSYRSLLFSMAWQLATEQERVFYILTSKMLKLTFYSCANGTLIIDWLFIKREIILPLNLLSLSKITFFRHKVNSVQASDLSRVDWNTQIYREEN